MSPFLAQTSSHPSFLAPCNTFRADMGGQVELRVSPTRSRQNSWCLENMYTLSIIPWWVNSYGR